MSDCHTEDFPPGWKFKEAAHTGVYSTKTIAADEEPIMRVFHDHDGSWQFHGAGESSPETAVLLCLHCIVESDPSIARIADLPVGWAAWRDGISSAWQREPYERSDEDE